MLGSLGRASLDQRSGACRRKQGEESKSRGWFSIPLARTGGPPGVPFSRRGNEAATSPEQSARRKGAETPSALARAKGGVPSAPPRLGHVRLFPYRGDHVNCVS